MRPSEPSYNGPERRKAEWHPRAGETRITTRTYCGPERRKAQRHPGSAETVCRVVDPLDQAESEAGVWDIGTSGISLLVEPHWKPGASVAIELSGPAEDASLSVWANVVHAILVPSQREMWLTGCSFHGNPVTSEEIEPYII